MDIQQLTRPFAPFEIKVREGKKGMNYQYIPSATVVKRLQEVLSPSGWNLKIKETIHIGDEIAVLVSLQIGNIVKEAYGSATMSGKSLGDALKTSQALGLVKCCSLLGMPVTFTSQVKTNNNRTYNNPPASFQQNSQQVSDQYSCDDCNNVITQPEIKFCLSNTQYYRGRKVCRSCQPNYKKRA